MYKEQILIFIENEKFSNRNKSSVTDMLTPHHIMSNGWDCRIYKSCIKFVCTRKLEGKTLKFKVQFSLGGHVTFKSLAPGEDWKKIKELWYPSEPDVFPDFVIGLRCCQTPEFFIRSFEEQNVYDAYRFKTYEKRDPNGNYEVQATNSISGTSYKRIFTDGEVKTRYSSKEEKRDGNGSYKNYHGVSSVSGASFLFYRVSIHTKETQVEESCLISLFGPEEVRGIIKKKGIKKRH